MISGTISPDREAILRLKIYGPQGQEVEIEAVLDTGFNGFLTLPDTTIAGLGLPQTGWGRTTLADGSQDLFPFYIGTILWDGSPKSVDIDEANTTPLVGMALLYGYEVSLPVLDGATFTIELIQTP